jgi:hypothetical protein
MSQKQFMEGNNRSTDFTLSTPAETSNQTGPGRWVLHSWKQVSAYVGLGVRTVQRYEIQFQLPVHRAAGKKRSAILAFTDELDAWLHNTPRLYGSPQPQGFPMEHKLFANRENTSVPQRTIAYPTIETNGVIARSALRQG